MAVAEAVDEAVARTNVGAAAATAHTAAWSHDATLPEAPEVGAPAGHFHGGVASSWRCGWQPQHWRGWLAWVLALGLGLRTRPASCVMPPCHVLDANDGTDVPCLGARATVGHSPEKSKWMRYRVSGNLGAAARRKGALLREWNQRTHPISSVGSAHAKSCRPRSIDIDEYSQLPRHPHRLPRQWNRGSRPAARRPPSEHRSCRSCFFFFF